MGPLLILRSVMEGPEVKTAHKVQFKIQYEPRAKTKRSTNLEHSKETWHIHMICVS
jgi:hypothetical protein